MHETTDRVADGVATTDAAAAADTIPDDGIVPMSGLSAGPKDVAHELAASNRDRSLTVPASADAGFVADTELPNADALDLRYPFSAWPNLKRAVNEGRVDFVDDHLSVVEQSVARGHFGDPDVAVVEALAVGEDWLVPTTAVGAVPAFVAAADAVIVEVNEALPLELQRLHDTWTPSPPPRDPLSLSDPGERLGDQFVRFEPDKLAAVVRTENDPVPYPFREPTDAEAAIADNVVDFLADELVDNRAFRERFTFEVGIGSLGNEITERIGDLDFGDRRVDYYGEVAQDGLLDLLEAGTLSAASATALVLGEDGVDRLLDRPELVAENACTRSMSVSNDPGLIRAFGVVAINTAVEVDVYGHTNSSHVQGSQLLQGIGGSGDFARNSLLSTMVLPSTAKDGAVSRIVPMASHVDHPDHDVDVVVTEHGVADLRGLTPDERFETVVEQCADPDFRQELRRYGERAARGGGHMPHDLPTAFGMHGE
ncbi:acetyl-CoA hydrolase/transferase C-terminal domain-containing protein [Halorientalis pallida]|uniref:Acetyl-CoA hydrolase n=1 Tax=Halorientalis pallida TaxID=2479928 RepID=A0A498KZ08_9EURY|nr:acetyl-CoA hydrolase/transferase C-terminal domain-containing protein [Halorientalis pallida]RXK48426.1 acetyl-CoA hydrolase [Halorientalis pallida]